MKPEDLVQQIRDHKVELRPLHDLLPYARNSRKHEDWQVAKIAASIREFGFTNPVLIDSDGTIIAGHARVMAALKLDLPIVPCIVLGHLNETQRRAYVIADNQLATISTWDDEMLKAEALELQAEAFDLSLLGFSEDELKEIIDTPTQPSEGLTDPDAVPEVKETRCKPGQLWILGKHKLLCGDSTDVLQVDRLMGGEKADLWLTDPPYGVGYKGKTKDALEIKNDAMPLEQMGEFWTALAASALIATTDRAPYYWFACQGGDQMMMMMSISRAGWKVRHELIWVKDALVLSRCDYHYKHEPILYGWKQEGAHEFYGDRSQTSVLEFARPRKNDVHPTMKPVDLIEYLIGNSSKRAGKVFDTCLGSGTTLIACEKTDRRCFGMEIDPTYCDVILARWEAFTGLKAELISANG